MRFNEDALFLKIPRIILNYDEKGGKYYSISWFGYQIEFY